MHIARKALIGTTAAVALAGVCTLASARDAVHTMSVRAPGGGTVTVRYTGDVAPQIVFGNAPQTAGIRDWRSPFLAMERISAEMDRRMESMMRQADAIMAQLPDPNPVFPAGFWNAPWPMTGLSAIAGGAKGGFCMKSVEITSTGGGKPNVVTHSAGNCGPETAAAPAHRRMGTGPRTPI